MDNIKVVKPYICTVWKHISYLIRTGELNIKPKHLGYITLELLMSQIFMLMLVLYTTGTLPLWQKIVM